MLYIFSITCICLLLPTIIFFKKNKVYKPLVFLPGSVLGICVFWSLSRTCPYPVFQGTFVVLNIASVCAALILCILLIIYKLKGNKLVSFTKSDAHSWIMDALHGDYFVTNLSGQILSCGKTVLASLEPHQGETIYSFLKRAAASSKENRTALESFSSSLLEKKDIDGDLEISGRYYHWISRQLGKNKIQGYMLYLTDLTEERELINQREETGRLLKLKNDWLEKQGQTAVTLERSRISTIIRPALLLMQLLQSGSAPVKTFYLKLTIPDFLLYLRCCSPEKRFPYYSFPE